ncbi:MAG: hypothetical protein N3G75_01225 [Methanothrix sp.]|nr:hypothetical protein [Methanothrix sp.]MCX8206441.1 hypothetical protein [Methanothrix sp.]
MITDEWESMQGVDLMKFLLALVAILMMFVAPACAISVTASTAGSAGGATAHSTYSLGKDASLVSDMALGGGALSRQSVATGPGMIAEGVSSGSGSVIRRVAADSALSYAASDDASGGAVASGMQASLSGSIGMFSTVSSGVENEMSVAGGFVGEGGDMSVSLTSVAADQAMTTGQASALGTQCLNEELAQGIIGQDAAVSVHALYVADDNKIEEFGVVPQNAKGEPAQSLRLQSPHTS